MYIRNYKGWRKIYEDGESPEITEIVSTLEKFGDLKKGGTNKAGNALLQSVLKDAGKLTGTSGPNRDGVDGDFGPNTEGALLGLIGKNQYQPSIDSYSLTNKLELTGKDYPNTLSNWETLKSKLIPVKASSTLTYKGMPADDYGKSIGISDKSAYEYSKIKYLEGGLAAPIGDIVDSAWANLNVPTRGIKDTNNGNFGCAAAVSLIFYRATGLPIMKGRTKYPLELGTASLWKEFTITNKNLWLMITNWKVESKPGDIILTATGPKATGHVGVIVDNRKIISNCSDGFAGDNPGQIEQNYTVDSWATSVATRNGLQTAAFRYQGPFLSAWGGEPILAKDATSGKNDEQIIRDGDPLPGIIVNPEPMSIIQIPNQASPADTIFINNQNQLNTLLLNPSGAEVLFKEKEKNK